MSKSSFEINFTRGIPSNIKLVGGAHRPKDADCLRLTKTTTDGGSTVPLQNKSGRAIYKKSVTFSTETTFETTIVFTIKPIANGAPGDGLVFFMAPANHRYHSQNIAGGNLGIFGSSGEDRDIVAVEFDTYANPLWDPASAPHLGINLGSRKSNAHAILPRQFIGQKVTLRITYSDGELTASARTDVIPEVTLKHDVELSYILPDEIEVGLAASTGDLVAFHDVTSWEFSSTTPN